MEISDGLLGYNETVCLFLKNKKSGESREADSARLLGCPLNDFPFFLKKISGEPLVAEKIDALQKCTHFEIYIWRVTDRGQS